MDRVSVTKTYKILKTYKINKISILQAKLCFSVKILFGEVKVN